MYSHTYQMLISHTFLLQYIFSVWGNEMSPEKKTCTTFLSDIHTHLTCIKLYYHLVQMNLFLPVGMKKSNPALKVNLG